jgi:hypothetical protein
MIDGNAIVWVREDGELMITMLLSDLFKLMKEKK